MKPITAGDPQSQSADMVAENVAKLRSLFPEAFPEGAIDFAVLQQLLGGTVPEKEEKYGLNWHGKRAARQLALTPSMGTLRPAPADSVQWDTTRNIVIEGDNLEVLKLLQKSYSGKVKLIYIDPPYNTGKDFVYPDNFRDGIRNYQELTGQVEGGVKMGSNTETSGRFHTNWLNMMYPRLKLARNLLREDGVIFVSCDDSEAEHVKLLMSDVFGEENNLVTLYLQVRYAEKTLAEKNDYQKLIEQIHVFQRSSFVAIKESEDYTIDKFCWKITELSAGTPFQLGHRACRLFRKGEYEIKQVEPSMDALKETWATGTVLKANASGKFFGDHIEQRKDIDGLECLYKVDGIGEDGLGYRYFSGPKRDGATKGKFFSGVPLERRAQLADGTSLKFKPIPNFDDLSDSFGNCRHEGDVPFGSGKKPTALLKWLLDFSSKDDANDLILDFFAGSGTTGHAVMAQNAADGGSRRYILVQLPEPLEPDNKDQKTAANFCDSLGKPRTIAELTKERLRRAGKKVKADKPLFKGDTGFRVYKLDSSNIRLWDPKPDDLEGTVFGSVEHIKDGRTPDDILTELLLKLGLDLCVPIETKTIAKKKVHSIGGGVLLVCLDTQIATKQVEELALGIVEWHKTLAPAGDSQAVFRDSAFEDDIAKTNLTVILAQHGLANVRSL